MGCLKISYYEQERALEVNPIFFTRAVEKNANTPIFCLSSSRYGFNGKEKDDEVSGNGNSYDYGFRIYNPRLGRFLSTDPLFKGYPFYTPYQFAGNMPIWAIDLDGLEEKKVTQSFYNHGLGKAYLNLQKSEKLKRLLASVNLKEKQAETTVYYGVVLPSERGKGGLGGYTLNLKDAAKFVQYYSFSESAKASLSPEDKQALRNYKNLFETNGIDYNEIANSEKEVFGIFLDPTESEKDATFNLAHEVEAHLKNYVDGKPENQKKEHYKFYNYEENPELLEEYPELKDGDLSPPYEKIPKNSPAGEIKEEVDKVVPN